jgi:hypothetical protein
MPSSRRPRRSSPGVAALAAALLLLQACHRGADPGGATASPIPVVDAPGCVRPTVLDARVSIGNFRSAGGACVSPGRLLHVDCGAATGPLLLLGAGTRRQRTYLGGRFGVRVATLPSEASLAGRSGDVRVYTLPGRPGFVYVDSADGVRRWLALPPPSELSAPPTIFLMGDSILFGAQPYIADALGGWTASFDAEIGRPSSAGVAIAAAHARPAPDVAVVELGTNDADAAQFRANADAIVNTFSAAQLVVWVNVHSPDPAAAAVNREIRLAVVAAPNAVVADWNADVPTADLSSDGIHLSPGHEGAFASFLDPLLQAWRAAVDGRQATRCLPAIESAVRA